MKRQMGCLSDTVELKLLTSVRVGVSQAASSPELPQPIHRAACGRSAFPAPNPTG